MKESKLLQITSIIMIAVGAAFGIFALLVLIGAPFLSVEHPVEGGLFILGSSVMILASVIELIAGVAGVKAWNKPEKANAAFIMGIVILVLNLIGNGLSLYMSGFGLHHLGTLLLNLILPGLYTYGAYQLKSAK